MKKKIKIILIIFIGFIAILLATLAFISYQNKKIDSRCNWEHGYCKNICLSQNYYFDGISKECKRYVEQDNNWGCCSPPPFETLEECLRICK